MKNGERRLFRLSFTFVYLSLFISLPAFGWGFVGHGIVSEASTHGTPSEMPGFFHEQYPRLIWLGYEPDRLRGAGDSADAFNATNHFLDYEYVEHLELPDERYEYLHTLYESGTLRRFGIDNDTSGFLPWRIAELAQFLEKEWQIWARDDLTAGEREGVERTIVLLSGVIGHFVGDAANPHHSTIHYNGWALAPAPEGFATDCGTHSRFETQYVTKAIDRGEVFAALGPLTARPDYFHTALDLVRDSNSLVETIYTIDAHGGFDPANESPEAYRFTVSRLSLAGSILRDIWWTAYVRGTGAGNEKLKIEN